MKQIISTDQAPKASGVYSQAVHSNGLLFVAGQIHTTAEGVLVEGTIEQKLAQVMKNITAILDAAEVTLDDIVKVTMYVTDISELPELNKHYPGYFSDVLPAREAVCVKALPLGASLEISVIASKN